MNKKLQIAKYVTSDLLSAAIAWGLFFCYRKIYVQKAALEFDEKFYSGIVIIPLFWLLMYSLTGTYKNIYKKSRLRELEQTLIMSMIGVLALFFILLLDDEIIHYKQYYNSFFSLYALHFFITFIPRFILSSVTAYKIHNRLMGFNTLLVGSNHNAVELYKEIEAMESSPGIKFVGFVHVHDKNGQILKENLPHLGGLDNLKKAIRQHYVEEVILAIESSEHKSIGKIITELDDTGVSIKVIPDMYDILSGSVKMNSIYGAPLIEISHDIMPVWQQSLKRAIDFFISLFILLFGFPVFILTALCVKLTSKGPVLYTHERIGLHGKPFTIYKFRSMNVGAEKDGPALSSKNDDRITPFGMFMRKIRLDEIPQFYNVLTGDMSIVGPRPERQYYIEKIILDAPHYSHLHKVKPGITSWGQVKYGYAENVQQMIERLKYDIIYIENMSLAVDFKIMIYTILTILRRKGR